MKVVSHKAFSTTPGFSETDRDRTICHIADAVHRLNETIRTGVGSGISVELARASRCHDGCGNWGDQMIPVIREIEVTEKKS